MACNPISPQLGMVNITFLFSSFIIVSMNILFDKVTVFVNDWLGTFILLSVSMAISDSVLFVSFLLIIICLINKY